MHSNVIRFAFPSVFCYENVVQSIYSPFVRFAVNAIFAFKLPLCCAIDVRINL